MGLKWVLRAKHAQEALKRLKIYPLGLPNTRLLGNSKCKGERIESTFTSAALTTACRRRMDPAPWLGLAEQAVSVLSVADGPYHPPGVGKARH